MIAAINISLYCRLSSPTCCQNHPLVIPLTGRLPDGAKHAELKPGGERGVWPAALKLSQPTSVQSGSERSVGPFRTALLAIPLHNAPTCQNTAAPQLQDVTGETPRLKEDFKG
jgi:hypothetical protein